MQQCALLIKDSNVFKIVQDTLFDDFRASWRNYS